MENPSRFPMLFSDPFEDMFNRMMRPARWEADTRAPQIKLDVSETDAAYTVKAEVPGVKKEDIHVSIEGNRVSISAETKTEKEEKEGEKVLRSERYFGKVARSFTLAHEIDEAKADAKYADGVLELTLPKRAGGTAKKLTVK